MYLIFKQYNLKCSILKKCIHLINQLLHKIIIRLSKKYQLYFINYQTNDCIYFVLFSYQSNSTNPYLNQQEGSNYLCLILLLKKFGIPQNLTFTYLFNSYTKLKII